MIYTEEQKPPISELERSKQINFLKSGYNPITGMLDSKGSRSSIVVTASSSLLMERSLFRLIA